MAEISIPGDPGGLSSLAAELRAAADQVGTVQGRVSANGLHGSWSGTAALAFQASIHPLPGELGEVAAVLEEASRALASFASRLSELQQKAHWYERQIEGAEQEQSAAQARQEQAQTEVDAARLRHSAATDPASLHTAKQAVELGESAVSRAVADVEDTISRIAKLVVARAVLHREYEAAVSACCSALEVACHSSRNPFGGLGKAVLGLVAGVDRGVALWWRSGGKVVDEVVGDGHTLMSVLSHYFKSKMPTGRWRGPAGRLIRFADRRAVKYAGKGLRVFAVFGSLGDIREAFNESKGENWLGRGYTAVATGAGDAAMIICLPLAGADVITDGAVSADFKGFALIGGHAFSGGTDGLLAAYREDTADRASGNYLGLARHVAGGYVGGTLKGALAGDEQFANNAATGKYGGLVKGVSQAESFVIEHPGDVARAGSNFATGAAKGAWHEAGNLLGKL